MKTLKIEDNLYKELQELASLQKVEIEKLLEGVLYEGGTSIKERYVLELYRDGGATLAKCAELLSIDLWEMIEKIRKLDYHLDYSLEELKEDTSQSWKY
jgi:hypothetical protein